ncbi:MAG: hypothetical protein QM605_15145 [Sphingobium sp.]
MARRFWIAGGSATGAAILLGMGLGHFVTTPTTPPRPLTLAQAEASESADALGSPLSTETEKRPEVIRCTGCGPTLAERQMMMDQGAWDPDGMIQGSSDPVVQDYMASDEGPGAPVEAPSPAAFRLPPEAERFAAGEEASPAASPQSPPVQVRPTIVATQP